MPYILLDAATAAPAPTTTIGDPLTPPGTGSLPGLSLAEMRTQLDIQLGGRTDFDDTMFDLWINQAYVDLCTSLDIPQLKGSLKITTAVGQALYLLPNAVRVIKAVSVIDPVTYGDLGGRPLRKTDLVTYRRNPLLMNEPREWFHYNDMLVLWPSPIATRDLSIDFDIRPQDLVDENHYPILPKEWHEVIVRNARTKAHSDLREFQSAAITNNEVVGLVRRKNDPESEEQSNEIIVSSVPRSREQLLRRNSRMRADPDVC